MRLFTVEVSYEMVVYAEDEDHALQVARDYSREGIKQALKKAKREALLEAANVCGGFTWADDAGRRLHGMAEEL